MKCENIDDSCRVDTNEEDIGISPTTDPNIQETHNLESRETIRESYFKEEKNNTFEQSKFFIMDEFDEYNK